jgi:lipopolysaccharide transport system permease protein
MQAFTTPTRWRRIEPTRGWPTLAWGELWKYRELLAFFVWRDVKVRYKQTLLGLGWALVQPLATMIVFSIVFGRLAHLASDGVPYPAFSLAGLLPWMLFASGVTLAANSLVGNVNLLTKVYFPRVLLPVSNVVSGLLDFSVSFALLLVVLAWYGIFPSWRMLFLPLPIGLVLVSAAGAGLWLAALNAQYRDIRHAMPFLVQLWMYGTPIVYSLSIVPSAWRPLVALNPLVAAVETFRFAMLGTNGLSAAVVVVSTVSAVALLTSGAWYFRSMERVVADTI